MHYQAVLSIPQSVAFSPMAHILLLLIADSNDVTIFQVGAGGVLSGAVSYALPSGSS